MTQRMHHQEWRAFGHIAKIVFTNTIGKGRTSARLDGYRLQILPRSIQLVPEKREGETGKIAATSVAADYDIRIIASDSHLLHRFLPDDGLMQQDVVEHTAQ